MYTPHASNHSTYVITPCWTFALKPQDFCTTNSYRYIYKFQLSITLMMMLMMIFLAGSSTALPISHCETVKGFRLYNWWNLRAEALERIKFRLPPCVPWRKRHVYIDKEDRRAHIHFFHPWGIRGERIM